MYASVGVANETLVAEMFALVFGVELAVVGAGEFVEVETFAAALFVFELGGSALWHAMDHDTNAKTINSLDSLRALITLDGSP